MKLFNTADISDENKDAKIAQPIFKSYGENEKFSGKIRTVVAKEDNSYVKKLIEQKVNGDVMVIDGGGSLKCALLGDNLAMKAFENGWSGFVINGCIRDAGIINKIPLGVKALNVIPVKSVKNNVGDYSKTLHFAGIDFKEGEYIYSDLDGIIVLKEMLSEKDTTTPEGLVPYKLITFTKIY